MRIYSIVKYLNSQYVNMRLHHLVLFYVNKDKEPEIVYDDTFIDPEMVNLTIETFKNSNWKDARLYEADLDVSSVKYLGVFESQLDYDNVVSRVCEAKK